MAKEVELDAKVEVEINPEVMKTLQENLILQEKIKEEIEVAVEKFIPTTSHKRVGKGAYEINSNKKPGKGIICTPRKGR